MSWIRAAGVGKEEEEAFQSPEFVVDSVKDEGPLWKTIKQIVEFPN